MFVTSYVVVLGYLGLAAISPVATVVPNTLPEFARLVVLLAVGVVCSWWGGLTSSRRWMDYIYPPVEIPSSGEFPGDSER